MNTAPAQADGATVLCSAELSGLAPTGACTHRRDGAVQTDFAGLLIARYASDGVYLFYCDQEWDVQNDTLHDSVEEAKAFAEREFPGVGQRWRSP